MHYFDITRLCNRHPYNNGYVQHMCYAYGAFNAAHVQAALMCRICASFCHILYYAQHVCYLCMRHMLLAHMHATGMLLKCLLHVCMLQHAAYMLLTHMQATIFLVCAASIHGIICSAAYTLLTHMQATSIPRMCSLHHAYYYSAAYFAAHIRHVYSIHAAYIQHTS